MKRIEGDVGLKYTATSLDDIADQFIEMAARAQARANAATIQKVKETEIRESVTWEAAAIFLRRTTIVEAEIVEH
jgi:hypothetical protein